MMMIITLCKLYSTRKSIRRCPGKFNTYSVEAWTGRCYNILTPLGLDEWLHYIWLSLHYNYHYYDNNVQVILILILNRAITKVTICHHHTIYVLQYFFDIKLHMKTYLFVCYSTRKLHVTSTWHQWSKCSFDSTKWSHYQYARLSL